MRSHRRRWLWGMLAAAALALLSTGAAGAAITPVTNTPLGATAIANAIAATPGIVTGATFVIAPPFNSPNGTADSPLASFPTNGSTFGILTSGEVQNVDDPGTFTNVNDGGLIGKGSTDHDVTILAINLNAPASSNCLTFDFKFLSEEYPYYVGSDFNDAFIAELDANTWTTAGSNIVAPDNFAFDANGNVVSVNSTGIGGMTPARGAGTAYDGDGSTTVPPPAGGSAGGATVVLSASTQITPGVHTLYLSIFDQGDLMLDSAVFLDNLRIGFVPNPDVNCRAGAQPVNFRLSLTPAADENPVGTSHTVTATLTDENGNPVPMKEIQFQVSGANTAAGVNVTDSSGQATFTYPGTHTGDDTITACFNADNSADGSCEAVASATKHWVIGPPATLVLSPPTDTNTVGSQHCLTATVSDAVGNPTPGITVRFSVTGSVTTGGSAVTDMNGVATFCYTGPTAPGADVIAAFADTDNDNTRDLDEPADTAHKTWVPGPPATLVLSPAADANTVGSEHCVTATVRDALGNPTPGITVRFRVTGSVTTGGSATTNASGQATFCYTGPALPGADTITAYADTDNDNTQDAGEPANGAAKAWVVPASGEGCKVTYGGRITAADGDKATFGGNAHAPSKGQEEYQDHGPATDINVHSINVQAVTCSADGKRASIFGRATVDGSGSYDYRIDVTDLGEPGSNDTYRIRLSNGYDSGEQVLAGGNVQIH